MLLRKSTGIPGEAGSERESGIEAGMYECAEAVYQNEIWRAASLKDENGNYKQELRLKMKKESQKHCFSCPECGGKPDTECREYQAALFQPLCGK